MSCKKLWAVNVVLFVASFSILCGVDQAVSSMLRPRPKSDAQVASEYEEATRVFSPEELQAMERSKMSIQRDFEHNRYKIGGYWLAWPRDGWGRPFPENHYGFPYDPSVPGNIDGMMAGVGAEKETLHNAGF